VKESVNVIQVSVSLFRANFTFFYISLQITC